MSKDPNAANTGGDKIDINVQNVIGGGREPLRQSGGNAESGGNGQSQRRKSSGELAKPPMMRARPSSIREDPKAANTGGNKININVQNIIGGGRRRRRSSGRDPRIGGDGQSGGKGQSRGNAYGQSGGTGGSRGNGDVQSGGSRRSETDRRDERGSGGSWAGESKSSGVLAKPPMLRARSSTVHSSNASKQTSERPKGVWANIGYGSAQPAPLPFFAQQAQGTGFEDERAEYAEQAEYAEEDMAHYDEWNAKETIITEFDEETDDDGCATPCLICLCISCCCLLLLAIALFICWWLGWLDWLWEDEIPADGRWHRAKCVIVWNDGSD